MSSPGRPRLVTTEAIVDAGIALTLPNVTVRAIARALGVSEMSVYRRVGEVEQLRTVVAEGIIERADFAFPEADDPEDALVQIGRLLRDFVLLHPGIAEHLANLDPRTPVTVGRIDEAQSQFAERYAIPAAHASILVSTVAEHAIALAALRPRSHSEVRDPDSLDAANTTVRAGAQIAAPLSPEARFDWAMRAVARGAMTMLALPTRADTPR